LGVFGTLFAYQTNTTTYFGAFFNVAAYKKKIVALLAAAVFLSCLVGDAPCNSRYNAGNNTQYSCGGLLGNDPNFSGGPADSLNTGELFFKMMLSVLLVIGLGAAAIYISKKLLPKIANLPGKEIRVIETVHLGPRKTVHLLQVGNRRLLIGSTGESITKLADVTTDSTDGLTD
jgi:flagellar biosynthetic protein FliO